MNSHENLTIVKIFFASLWDLGRVFPRGNISFNSLHTKKPNHATKELQGIFNNNDATLVNKFQLVTHLSRASTLMLLQPYLACKLSSKSNVDKVLTSWPLYNFVYANLWIGLFSSSPCGKWRTFSITFAYSSFSLCVSSFVSSLLVFVVGETPSWGDGGMSWLVGASCKKSSSTTIDGPHLIIWLRMILSLQRCSPLQHAQGHKALLCRFRLTLCCCPSWSELSSDSIVAKLKPCSQNCVISSSHNITKMARWMRLYLVKVTHEILGNHLHQE
jgi:hypothetical protein